jgi:hypothetical protein
MLDIQHYPYEALRHSLVYEAISWLRLLNMRTFGSSSISAFFGCFFFWLLCARAQMMLTCMHKQQKYENEPCDLCKERASRLATLNGK